jgi:hypothetical protein
MRCPRYPVNLTLQKYRGRREDRVPAAPMAPCAASAQKMHTGCNHRYRRNHTGLPCAVVYGLLRTLPGEPDFVVTVISAMRMHHRQLSASHGAPGPHDFAVRARADRRSARSRPPHPALNVRDDAYAPHRGGMGENMRVICPTAQPDGMRHINATGKLVWCASLPLSQPSSSGLTRRSSTPRCST